MPIHYVIFHPDRARQTELVSAIALVGGQVVRDWSGDIFVDRIGVGNEDPFVFHDSWVYSYCHASQLKRSQLEPGSTLLFVSGNRANDDLLAVDTVFVIGEAHLWVRLRGQRQPVHVPSAFRAHERNAASGLWRRHLKFPFQNIHLSVTHTFAAEMWNEQKEVFAYLPLDEEGDKATIHFDSLGAPLAAKIRAKVRGKYPVQLNDGELQRILKALAPVTHTQVVRITGQSTSPTSNTDSDCAC